MTNPLVCRDFTCEMKINFFIVFGFSLLMSRIVHTLKVPCPNRQYIIFATIDGNLTALDFSTGNICWSIVLDNNSFFSSSLSKIQVKEKEILVDLVPSLDGHLFKYDKFKLVPLNVSVEDIIFGYKSLFSSTRSFGGKFKFIFGIDKQTGQVSYNCSISGCNYLKKLFPEEMIVIEKIVKSVKSIDSVTAEERWSLKTTELHITESTLNEELKNTRYNWKKHNLTTVEKNALIVGTTMDFKNLLNRIKISLLKGLIALQQKDSNTLSWFYKAASQIIDVWFVDEHVYLLNPFLSGSSFYELESDDGKEIALLYLGCYKEQLFIIQSRKLKSKSSHTSALMTGYSYEAYCLLTKEDEKFSFENNKNALISTNTYELDKGYYFYINLSVTENATHCIVGFNFEKQSKETVSSAWLKFILLIIVIVAILLGYVIGILVKKNSQKVISIHTFDSASKHESNKEEDFVSRFHKEFHFLNILGKGGFGVVMEAKNKIDGCSYAVKRIPICFDGHKIQSFDDVLREVKTLAQLDHPHIVRYFNSWVENPPPGWQNEKDIEFNIIDVTKNTTPTNVIDEETILKEESTMFLAKKRAKLKKHIPEHHCSTKSFDRDLLIRNKLNVNPFGNDFELEFETNEKKSRQFNFSSESVELKESDSEDICFKSENIKLSEKKLFDSSTNEPPNDYTSIDNDNFNIHKTKLFLQLQEYMKRYKYRNTYFQHYKKEKDHFSNFAKGICFEKNNEIISPVYNKFFREDEVFSFLVLINNCFIYKLNLKEIEVLKLGVLFDTSSDTNDSKGWLHYLDIFSKLNPKKLSSKLIQLRNWIISALCILRLFDSYYHNLLQMNLCNMLWDINLIINNNPFKLSPEHIYNFSKTKPIGSCLKSSALGIVKDVNNILCWPLKKDYLNDLGIILFCDDFNHQEKRWKSIFSQNDYVIYIKNLRLFQIWIISVLIHFKYHEEKLFNFYHKNLCYILFQVNQSLNCEIAHTLQDNSLDLQRNVFCSTTNFIERNVFDQKSCLMFHQKHLQKILKKPVVEKHNKPGYLYIQMQLCQRESYESWLMSHSDSRNYEEIMKIFFQIVSAIDYVHVCGHMHRDLKPSNIYFSKEGLIKIGDFGLATRFEVEQESSENTSIDFSVYHTHGIGTLMYLSPEQYSNKIYNSKTDMYSLGLILYESLFPMKTHLEKVKRFTDARDHIFPVQFIHQYPRECELIRRLLSYDPVKRPSANELKSHPLFQKYLQL